MISNESLLLTALRAATEHTSVGRTHLMWPLSDTDVGRRENT